MKVTLNWLREFVDLPESAAEVGEVLANLGFKPESIEDLPLHFSGVSVARVVGISPHPDADKIRVVDIDTGGTEITVVCGAWNFDEGAVVAYAPPGSVLAGGFDVGTKEIRGVESPGMIASERELGLSDDHEGILVLPPSTEVGASVADLTGLPDTVIDVEVNANRPDCMSVLGLARELAAFYGRELREPEIDLPDFEGGPAVDISGNCHRFVARRVEGVTVAQSPLWLRARLQAAGVRPISNVVDATNYAMLELGHPTHAFDADLLGDTIEVRQARAGEVLTTLDDVDRTLEEEDIVVTDGARPRALGGVMGGADSEVTAGTDNVIVEAAYFDPPSVMRTAARHGLHSEASIRFQRGMDPNAPRRAADRVAQLLVEYAGGRLGGVTDSYPEPTVPQVVSFDLDLLDRVLGKSFSESEVREILEPLGFEVGGGAPTFEITVPTRRIDVTSGIDFTEEIARFHGYDNFGKRVAVGPGFGLPIREVRHRLVRAIMVGAGFHETATFSFISQKDLDGLALPADDARRQGIDVVRPLRAEEGVMRTTLLPGLLRAAAANVGRGLTDAALFETGKVFLDGGDEIPHQPDMLGFVAVGEAGGGWFGDGRAYDASDAIGIVTLLASQLGIDDLSLEAAQPPAMHPGRTAEVRIGERVVGTVGELHPRVAQSFGIDGRVIAGELDLSLILEPRPPFLVTEPSTYPPAIFDVAFDLPQDVPAGHVTATLREAGGDLIEDLDVFDVFTGPPLGDDRKSLAYRVVLRALDRTLTDSEAAEVRDLMSSAVASAHDGILRSG